jgi:microcompartment protein CcmK/EutM
MQIARVVGTVVATQKHRKFEGAKLLLVQPLTLDDQPRGAALLAVDSVGAGVHEKVLVVIEGRAAAEAVGRKGTPVDAAIVGIVDAVDIEEERRQGVPEDREERRQGVPGDREERRQGVPGDREERR